MKAQLSGARTAVAAGLHAGCWHVALVVHPGGSYPLFPGEARLVGGIWVAKIAVNSLLPFPLRSLP